MIIDDMLSQGWTMLGLGRALKTDPATLYRWRKKGKDMDHVAQLALSWLSANDMPENWRGGHTPLPPLTYLILDADAVKIGCAREPKARLKDLQVGCVRTLKLHMVLDVPEKVVQEACAPFHVRGEWYRWGPDLQRAINQFLPHAVPLRSL